MVFSAQQEATRICTGGTRGAAAHRKGKMYYAGSRRVWCWRGMLQPRKAYAVYVLIVARGVQNKRHKIYGEKSAYMCSLHRECRHHERWLRVLRQQAENPVVYGPIETGAEGPSRGRAMLRRVVMEQVAAVQRV